MKERRELPRTPVDHECTLTIMGREVWVRVEDFSDIGARFCILADRNDPVTDDDLGADVSFVFPVLTPARACTGELIRRYFSGDAQHIVVRFWKKCVELPRKHVGA